MPVLASRDVSSGVAHRPQRKLATESRVGDNVAMLSLEAPIAG